MDYTRLVLLVIIHPELDDHPFHGQQRTVPDFRTPGLYSRLDTPITVAQRFPEATGVL